MRVARKLNFVGRVACPPSGGHVFARTKSVRLERNEQCPADASGDMSAYTGGHIVMPRALYRLQDLYSTARVAMLTGRDSGV